MGILEGREKFMSAVLEAHASPQGAGSSGHVFVHLCRVYKLFSSQIPIPFCPFSFQIIEKEHSLELQYFGKSWT